MPITAQVSATGGVASTDSLETLKPMWLRTVARSSSGRSGWAQARARRCRSPYSANVSSSHAPPPRGPRARRDTTELRSSSRRRPATPGTWASTIRAARSASAPGRVWARPVVPWSASQRSSSASPRVTRSSRCSARAAAAASCSSVFSTDSLAAGSLAPVWFFVDHSNANRLIEPPSSMRPSAHRYSNPSTCLHGNLWDGHEQRYVGPDTSIATLYGVFPDPWHAPHSSGCDQPMSDHGTGVARRRPATSEAESGASAVTLSGRQRSLMTRG